MKYAALFVLLVCVLSIALAATLRTQESVSTSQSVGTTTVPAGTPALHEEAIPLPPLEEMIGGLFMVGHWSHTNVASTSALIADAHVGGVIIMSVPEVVATVKDWVTQWQKVSPTSLLVSTDQEGGVVQRVKGPGYITTSQREIVDEDQAYTVAKKRGEELAALGVHMNFAPVLDSAQNKNSFMYKRVFTDTTTSHYFADAMIHGFEDAGVVATVKHFPGHDDTQADSHFTVPSVDIEKSELATFTRPFAQLIATHPPQALMTAHVLFPRIDTKPATLSRFFLTDYLRGTLGFTGVIVTDDMTMDAIDTLYSTNEATILALEAGADLILFAAEPERARSAIEKVKEAVASGRLTRERIAESYKRIEQLRVVRSR